MLDVPLIRLQYEFLNKPIDMLEDEAGLPSGSLQSEANKNGWKQYWPDADMVIMKAEADEDILVVQSERFIDRATRRLAVFKVAKEMLLAQRYAKLEAGLIQSALFALDDNLGTKEIKELSSLYKDMSAKSITSQMQALSFGEDEGGLPTVIIRDLTGRE